MAFSKEYVFRTLREEHLWKDGESDTFCYTTAGGNTYKVEITREEERYAPFKYRVNAELITDLHKSGFRCLVRRFLSMDDAFRFIVNDFSECIDNPHRYASIENWLFENKNN